MDSRRSLRSVFFSAFWWLPLFFLSYASVAPAIGLGLFIIVYHVILRLPHFLATYPITYGQRSNWARYRKEWIRFLLIPALILGVYFEFGDYRGTHGIGIALTLLAPLWGLQHIAFQNFGLMQIYHAKAGQQHPVARRWEWWTYFFVFAASAVVVGFRRIPNGTLQGTLNGSEKSSWLFSLAPCLFISGLVALYFFRERRRLSWPSSLFFLSSVFGMLYWPLYDRLPWPANTLVYFYAFDGQHCLSYLGLVSLIEGRSVSRLSVTRTLLFVGALIAVSALAVGALYFFQPGQFVHEMAGEKYRAFAAFEGFYVIHYYLESFIWKRKDESARSNLFPHLGVSFAK